MAATFILDVDGTLHGGAPDPMGIHKEGYRNQAWGEDHALVRSKRPELSQLDLDVLDAEFKRVGNGSRDRGLMELSGFDLKEFAKFRLKAYHPQEFLRPDQELHEVLQRLSTVGQLIVLSDNPAARPTLRALGVGHLFQKVFTSDEIGFKCPATYQKLFQLLGVAPRDCWVFGDSQYSDIDCAVVAGVPVEQAVRTFGAVAFIAAINRIFPA